MANIDKFSEEIDAGEGYAGYREAYDLIMSNAGTAGTEKVPLAMGTGRVAARDIVTAVSYPTVDVSLKDGYAIVSDDIDKATPDNPVRLKITGSIYAGAAYDGKVATGKAVKICSGGPIPPGADAVVAIEFTEETGDVVTVRADAGKGRNILRVGGEVAADETIAKKGDKLLPGLLGLAAAGGVERVEVYRRPRLAIIGVGDEVVTPGEKLQPGQLYASNLVTMEAWLNSFGVPCQASVAQDSEADLSRQFKRYAAISDVIITSGGAWGSERDLVVGVLHSLGWRELFHHVRMGPGKGIAFGIWDGKPVFCLPGGPPSNEMAFIQLALPGILRMGGDTKHPLQTVRAKLLENVRGRHPAWTEFRDAFLERQADGSYTVRLYKDRSRMRAVASANSLICKPEGRESLSAGEAVTIQVLAPRVDDIK